jgi:hypothetical protein
MTHNFAAHLDILGFGNAVLTNFDEAWGALSDLWHAMDKALRTIPIPIATGVPLVDKVRSFFFSDSVILYDALPSDVKRKCESTVAFLNAHPVSK